MHVSLSLYLFLLAVLSSNGTPSSAEDYFYLTLTPIEREEEIWSDREDLGVWGSGTSQSSNTSNATTQCEFRSNEVPVGCSCGESLENSTRDHHDIIETTCDKFDELTDPDSIFSFCANTLLTLGQGYEIETRSIAPSANLEVFTDSTLAERISQMERELRLFRQVLDRTIMGLLVATDRDKCYCFDRYKKWLCTTRLPFFAESNSVNFTNCTTTDPAANTTAPGEISLVTLKPCIEVCHDVLQNCPYYTPARYQPPRQSIDMPLPTPDDPMEVIYGGYPAFDCPRQEYAADLNQTSYIFNCDSNNADRGDRIDCINMGSAYVHHSNTIVVSVSILLFVLLIRTITC